MGAQQDHGVTEPHGENGQGRGGLCAFSQNVSRCVGSHSQTRNITWRIRAGHLQAAICCVSLMVKLYPEVFHLAAKGRKTVTRGRFIFCGFISEENRNTSFTLGMPWPTEPCSLVINNLPSHAGLSSASPGAPLHFPAPTSPSANADHCSTGNLPARHHEHLQLSEGMRRPSC